MVDSIRPTYRPLTAKPGAERVKESSDVETPTDDKSGQSYIVTKDRRGSRDRRNKKGESRPIYDMRDGDGRRKDDDGRPNIKIEV